MEEIDGNVIRPGSVKDKVEIKGVETGKESREEETHVSVCHWGGKLGKAVDSRVRRSIYCFSSLIFYLHKHEYISQIWRTNHRDANCRSSMACKAFETLLRDYF